MDKQQLRILELEAAIDRLITAKGRYHTQIAMADLYAIVGKVGIYPENYQGGLHG